MTTWKMAWLALALAACGDAPVEDDTPVDTEVPKGDEPTLEAEVSPGAPTLRRLTRAQYRHALRDLFGDIVLPSQLEDDAAVDGLVSVGAAVASVSTRGVELYEDAAYDVVEQVVADTARYGALVPCTPEAPVDDGCMTQVIEDFGLRAWRRPVTSDEVDRYLDVAEAAADSLGSFEDGVTFVLAGMIQSPNFLLREEWGTPTESGPRQLTDHELASRLSFFLWNTLPDGELLRAAAAGELGTADGLATQVDRMLDDPRMRDGLEAIFDDIWELAEVPDISKDPLLFSHMSATLGEAARRQTHRDLAWWLLEEDGDYRDLFTMRTTHLNRELASVYGVAAPSRVGFGRVELPASLGRVGVLGQVSFLAHQAHPVATSPTLRGLFVRERLLCHEIQPPPAGVDTSIPEPNPNAPTMRDRLDIHLENPSCAGCHRITDPVGLAFENFDGIGRHRETERGVTIDPSGDLDEAVFKDAAGLAELIRTHPDVPACLVDETFRYALGRSFTEGEEAWLRWLTDSFVWGDHSVKHLLRRFTTSEGFRMVGDVEEEAP